MWPVFLGSICLGVVIGWLVRFFLERSKRFTLKVLSGVVSVITGAAVTEVLGSYHVAHWAYPIGLLIGLLAYPWLLGRVPLGKG
jgi:hypothetical protein